MQPRPRVSPITIGGRGRDAEGIRLSPDLLAKLAEPGTVVMDEDEVGRLGVRGLGEQAEVMGVKVRVVGFVKGYRSLGGPYLFCSIDTARQLTRAITEISRNGQPPVLTEWAASERPPFFFFHGDYISDGLYVRRLASFIGGAARIVSIAPGISDPRAGAPGSRHPGGL